MVFLLLLPNLDGSSKNSGHNRLHRYISILHWSARSALSSHGRLKSSRRQIIWFSRWDGVCGSSSVSPMPPSSSRQVLVPSQSPLATPTILCPAGHVQPQWEPSGAAPVLGPVHAGTGDAALGRQRLRQGRLALDSPLRKGYGRNFQRDLGKCWACWGK